MIILTGLPILIIIVPGIRETPLRIIYGLPLVFFLSAYAFIAVLFSERGTIVDADEDAVKRDGEQWDRTVAFSSGLNIAIVSSLGLVLNFTPWRIHLRPITLNVSAPTIGCTLVAVLRRWELARLSSWDLDFCCSLTESRVGSTSVRVTTRDR